MTMPSSRALRRLSRPWNGTSVRVLLARALPLYLALAPVAAIAQTPPAPAAAAPAKKPSFEDVLRAAKLSEDAGKLAKKKDWAGALAAWSRANELEPKASRQLAIARAQRELGRYAEAYGTLERLLATSEKKLSGPDRAEARKLLDELAKKTGLLEIRATEAGAEVKIDGAPAGTTPLAAPVRTAAGAHEVGVAKAGFEPFATKVELPAGEQRTVDAKLEPEVKTGHVAIQEKSGAQVRVLIDANDVGAAPWEGDLPPGRHTIVLQSDTRRTEEQALEIVTKHRYDLTLTAAARTGKVHITTQPATAQITIDGQPVGQGSYQGDVPVGEHQLEISAPGYEHRAGKLQVKSEGEAALDLPLAPSVVAAAKPAEEDTGGYRGVYVGFDFFGATPMPPISYACTTGGADDCTTSKQLPMPVGGGLDLRIGYSFGVIGLEVAGAGLAHYQQETNSYPGTGPVTPGAPSVDASVARDETFRLLSAGGFGGVGLRATSKGKVARVTIGAAGGLAMRRLMFQRQVSGDVNDSTASTVGYTAPGLLADAGLLLGGTPGVKFKLGVIAWVDFPGGDKTTDDQNPYTAKSDTGGQDRLLDTPPFLLAKSPNVFIGPTLGLQFGR